MRELTYVFERLRNYLRKKHERYEFPDNAIIADCLLTTIQIPMFFEEAVVNTSDGALFSRIINPQSKKKKVLLFLKSISSGVFLFLLMVLRIFAPSAKKKVHLVFSLTELQIRDLREMRAFLSDSRFNMNISEDELIIVENRHTKQGSIEKTFLVRDSMYWLYQNSLSPFERVACLREIVVDIFVSILRGQYLRVFLLKQLMIDKHIFKYAIRNQVILSLVTTQTHLQKLPSCFYFANELNINRIMLWYSDNSWVFNQIESIRTFDHSRYKRDFIDYHYCWSTEWQGYLESFQTESSVYVTSSIMFYKNEVANLNSTKIHDVLVFDVTPGVALGEYDFYSDHAINNFYDEIKSALALCSVPNLRVAIKNKRTVNHNLDEWVEENNILVIDPNLNLYELIASARVVIGIPLVSPVKIAKELNIPCAYYYPRQIPEWDLQSSYSDIPIFREMSDLSKWISSNLDSH